MHVNFNAVLTIINGLPTLGEANWHLWNGRSLDFFVIASLNGIHDKFPDKPTEADALKEWNIANKTLKPLLATKVADEYRYLIDDLTTVDAAYKKLKDHFQQSTLGSRVAARAEFKNVVHDPSIHISAFFHAVETARSKLTALGVTVDDKEVIDVILEKLHPSLHSARTALYTNKEEPTLQTVKETLVGASSSTSTIEPIVKIEGAYAARSPYARAVGSPPAISDSKGNTWCNTRSNGCHRCGRLSHQAYRCTTDMPPEVKDQILSPAESAAAAAAFASKPRSYTPAEFRRLAAALEALNGPDSGIWAHEKEEGANFAEAPCT